MRASKKYNPIKTAIAQLKPLLYICCINNQLTT